MLKRGMLQANLNFAVDKYAVNGHKIALSDKPRHKLAKQLETWRTRTGKSLVVEC